MKICYIKVFLYSCTIMISIAKYFIPVYTAAFTVGIRSFYSKIIYLYHNSILFKYLFFISKDYVIYIAYIVTSPLNYHY